MTESLLSSMYSKQGLRALEQSLQLHLGLVWVDPTTNTIAVKRVVDSQEGEPPEIVTQVNV